MTLRRTAVVAALITTLAATMLPAPPAGAATSAATWGTARHLYSPSGAKKYAYAPSAITHGGHTYVYTCHNNTSGVIIDHIYFSQVDQPGARPQQDRSVLRPSASGWDSKHTCDPTVIAAKVRYAGTTYRYVMFYLGTDHPSSNNQIGVAFANDLGGPWVKYPKPLVKTPFSDTALWGVGQPSATTINPETGEMMLFYTQGGRTTEAYFRRLKLGDMSKPVVGPPVRITDKGLAAGGVVHNFDIAYDPPTDRFYAIREAPPYPTSDPTMISARLEVMSIDGASIWSGTGAWTSEGFITSELTGFPRNHNPGILRTVYGTLPKSGSITAVFSVAKTGPFPQSLWTYHLWQVQGTLR